MTLSITLRGAWGKYEITFFGSRAYGYWIFVSVRNERDKTPDRLRHVSGIETDTQPEL